MTVSDLPVLIVLFVYLISLIGFLVSLKFIPRPWRLAGYVVFSDAHVFAAYFLHSLNFLQRNIASGERTQQFFKSVWRQLAAGSLQPEFAELPGYVFPILLSLLAAAAILGGGVLLWQKIRWYSWPLLILAFFLSGFLFAFGNAQDDRQDIQGHNLLRKRIYELIGQKRAQQVPDRQLADAIRVGLKNYEYSYTSRQAEETSVEIIVSALRDLPSPLKEK